MKTLFHIAADLAYFSASIGWVANALSGQSLLVPTMFVATGIFFRAVAGSRHA